MKRLWGILSTLAGLAVAIYGIGQVKRHAQKAARKEHDAEVLKRSETDMLANMGKASRKHQEAKVHAAKADLIRLKTSDRLKELETKRGSNNAAELARRLGAL